VIFQSGPGGPPVVQWKF